MQIALLPFHLSPSDIAFLPNILHPEHMSGLKYPKPIHLSRSDYYTTTGPLFQYLSGAPLTKARLTSETR